MIQPQPTHANTEIDALVRTGLYQNHDEVISDALRNLLLNNKALRLELAVELFRADEVSLGRAAEIAGIDRWEFQDILYQRRIPIIIEAESAEAMDRDIARFFGKEHGDQGQRRDPPLMPSRQHRVMRL